jgi:hypothetical protein
LAQFYRKRHARELERASDDFEVLHAAVDRLGAIIGQAQLDDASPLRDTVEPVS